MADPRRRLILVATLIAIAFGSTGASSPIFFPVVVTDGRGQPVTGLGPSAFTVRDGARSLDVASLLAEDGPASVVILLDASMLVDEFDRASGTDAVAGGERPRSP